MNITGFSLCVPHRDAIARELQGKKGSEFILALMQGDESAKSQWDETRSRNQEMFSDLGAASAMGGKIADDTYSGLNFANANDTFQEYPFHG